MRENISGLIKENAIRLKESAPEVLIHCKTVETATQDPEFYQQGIRAINVTIDSNGKDSDSAFMAGSLINDFIQNNVSLKRFMSCKE